MELHSVLRTILFSYRTFLKLLQHGTSVNCFVETYAQRCLLLPRFAVCMCACLHSVSCETEVQNTVLTDVIISIITTIANIYLAFTMCQLLCEEPLCVIHTITLYYLSHILIQNIVPIIIFIIQVRKIIPR